MFSENGFMCWLVFEVNVTEVEVGTLLDVLSRSPSLEPGTSYGLYDNAAYQRTDFVTEWGKYFTDNICAVSHIALS